ncbi:MazG-like family protein [Streptomyces sp. SBC-4]|nr:MazG-like family protein [Streptomyces sp. SBC-4]MDV5143439.1 MazG-like family protein [Streptomyces sp. SBC-4]
METDPWGTINDLARSLNQFDAEHDISDEEQWTLQVLKMSEEVGKAAQAVIGARGANPRKEPSHAWQDVHKEVGDAAITCLVALARMRPDADVFFTHLLEEKAAAFLPAEPNTDNDTDHA